MQQALEALGRENAVYIMSGRTKVKIIKDETGGGNQSNLLNSG